MIISSGTNSILGWGLSAQIEDYDGEPPVRTVTFDRGPAALSPDRLALGAYLLYGHWISARMVTPKWHSPALSQAISRFSEPVWVQTEPVELYAKAIPAGRRRVRIDWSYSAAESGVGDADGIIAVERADHFTGSYRTGDSLVVGSNAGVIYQEQSKRDTALVGCGVLFAEDMDADVLLVPSSFDIASQRWNRLVALLGAAGLGLEQV